MDYRSETQQPRESHASRGCMLCRICIPLFFFLAATAASAAVKNCPETIYGTDAKNPGGSGGNATATSNQPGDPLTNCAVAFGGQAKSGNNGQAGGAGGDAKATATGGSLVRAEATGGNGGSGGDNANGGLGGSALADARGSVSAAVAKAGNGGSASGTGDQGNGGNASAISLGTVYANAQAIGGSTREPGTKGGVRGFAGSASSQATASASGQLPAAAVSYAKSGYGLYRLEQGTKKPVIMADSVAKATSATFASTTSTAIGGGEPSNLKQKPPDAVAKATATSQATGPGGTAKANSTATGAVGSMAESTATSLGGGATTATATTNGVAGPSMNIPNGVKTTVTAVKAAAAVPGGGAGRDAAVALAGLGTAAPDRGQLAALQAGSFAIGLPLASDVHTLSAGDSRVITELQLDSPQSNVLGLGEMGGRGTLGGAAQTYTSSAEFDLDTSQLGGDLKVGLLNPSYSGPGFNGLNFQILENGALVDQMNFTSLAGALSFFTDDVLDLGPIQNLDSENLALQFRLDLVEGSPGSEFNTDFLVATVPEPSTCVLLSGGLILMLVACRSRRKIHAFTLRSSARFWRGSERVWL